jgi:predicted AAA+ superfamily ATPase
MRSKLNDFEIRQNLEDFLVFGMYPEVRTASSSREKRFILDELANAYLLKDILEFNRLKNPHILLNLLSLLALQIGGEVSLNELSGKLGIDVKTVQRYLELLEKCFVIYNLRGFSRNLRNEVTRTGKYFFYDTGVRNAVIQNYTPLNRRNDAGALWENFMVMERLKTRSYHAALPGKGDAPMGRDYFWRTWEKQEIDLLEEYGGILHAFEFKWSPKKNPKPPSLFMETYPDSEYAVVSPDNFTDFV